MEICITFPQNLNVQDNNNDNELRIQFVKTNDITSNHTDMLHGRKRNHLLDFAEKLTV